MDPSAPCWPAGTAGPEQHHERADPDQLEAGAGRQVVVLDVRNQYEWDAGHFQGAERPMEVSLPGTATGGALPSLGQLFRFKDSHSADSLILAARRPN